MDWKAFFDMGGYAVFVWGSYAAALVVLGINLCESKKRLKKAKQRAER